MPHSKSSINCDIQQPSSTFNDIDDGNDEDNDAYHSDDAVDACSSEQAADEFKQAFDDAFSESNGECNDSNDDEQKDKEVLHNI
jgi:hypothetical protein